VVAITHLTQAHATGQQPSKELLDSTYGLTATARSTQTAPINTARTAGQQDVGTAETARAETKKQDSKTAGQPRTAGQQDSRDSTANSTRLISIQHNNLRTHSRHMIHCTADPPDLDAPSGFTAKGHRHHSTCTGDEYKQGTKLPKTRPTSHQVLAPRRRARTKLVG
jgi:hypothetical protein